jgi:hypothetical protein
MNAIIINTSEGQLIVPVSNLGKEVVLEAISKTLEVPRSNIKEIVSNEAQGIYAIVNLVPAAVRLGSCSAPTDEYYACFIINFCKMKDT